MQPPLALNIGNTARLFFNAFSGVVGYVLVYPIDIV